MMDVAIVPRWEWVRTVNGNNRFGEHRGIREGSCVKLIGEHGDRVLVRYEQQSLLAGGTECRRGDIFWLDKKRFESMTEEYLKVIEDRKKEVAIVADLLAKERSRKP